MKIGIPRILFVTIRSILSDTVSLAPAFFTVVETSFWMYLYLSSVMIDSMSSSFFSSRVFLISLTLFLASEERFSCGTTFESFSRTLTAYHLFFCALTDSRREATLETESSTSEENISLGRATSS